MSFLALIPIELGLMVLGRLLRPKSPQRPGDKFTVPDIIEGTPLPYVFGVAKVDRPFLAWWGNVDSVLDTGVSSQPTEYYAAMVFDICQGPVAILFDVAFGGKSLAFWPTTPASQFGQARRPTISVPTMNPPVISPALGFGLSPTVTVFSIVAEDLFGGPLREGGVVGQMRFYPGTDGAIIYEPLLLAAGLTSLLDASGNPITNPLDGASASGQPFICYAAFDGYPGASWPSGVQNPNNDGAPRFNSFWWGNNQPSPRTVSFVVGRWPSQLQGLNMIGWDANPVNVIWELLTDPIAGAGLDEALFDKTAFQAAALQCYKDVLGVSGTIDTPTKLYDLLVDLLRHIDGTIFPDPITGLYSIRLARPDYDPATLDVLDESRMDALTVSRFDWSETINQLILSYRRFNGGGQAATSYTNEVLTLHYHGGTLIFQLGSFGAYYTVAHPPISGGSVTVHNVTQATSVVATTSRAAVFIANPATGLIAIATDFANEGDEITVDYTSSGAELGFIDASYPIQNLSNRQATGEVRSETADFRFFTNDVSAFNRGRLLLQALSSPLDKVTWTEDRRGNVRRPGDVVVLNVPEKGLNNTVIRIVGIDYGLLQQGKIKCEGVEDVYGKLLTADFGAPGGTSAPPINPVVRQAPAMAISCVTPGEIRIGLFGQSGFSIELHRATSSGGAGDTLVSATISGTAAYYDDAQTVGVTKYYRARLIAPGFDPGPWTAWMSCTSTAGTPGTPVCTIPTVAEAKTETSTVGTLTLTITDPQARLIMVEAKSQNGTAPETAYSTLAGPTYAPTVNFTGALRSTITYRISYLDCSGGISQIVKTVNFDAPTPPTLVPRFTAAGLLFADWSLDATGQSVKIAGSLSGQPSQGDADAATALNGATGSVGLVGTAASPGDVGYVSGVSFSGTGGTGRESALTQVQATFGGIASSGAAIGAVSYREPIFQGFDDYVRINNFPSAETDVATIGGVTQMAHGWKNLLDAGKANVRMQCRIASALSGAKFALKYWNGSAWRFLDGVSGPFISLAAANLQKGAWVPVEAAVLADRELKLVAIGGDDASPVIYDMLLYEWVPAAADVTPAIPSGGGGGGTGDCSTIVTEGFEYADNTAATAAGWTFAANGGDGQTWIAGATDQVHGGSKSLKGTLARAAFTPYPAFTATKTFTTSDGILPNSWYTVKVYAQEHGGDLYASGVKVSIVGGGSAGGAGADSWNHLTGVRGQSDSSGNLTVVLERALVYDVGQGAQFWFDDLTIQFGDTC